MKTGSILVVDDNKNVISALQILLDNYFRQVWTLSSPKSLMTYIREKRPDLILLDMNFSAGINSGNEGRFWLSEIKKLYPEIPVVLFTAYADIELAVNALKEGASDFIVKPWDNSKLISTLQNALKNHEPQDSKNSDKECIQEDVCWGRSQVMQDLLLLVRKIARTDANVLITGENGTGKEVIAKEIHRLSSRSDKRLVSVDMGAITESLFESELFGHIKGSFTDAKSDRAGKFETADNGTLFLDEIGNLSYALQAKLLSALQSRQITRVGSNNAIPINIRLICATNRDLFHLVRDGAFREDLLYRINTIQIEVPALRSRPEDISMLINFFLKRLARRYNQPHLTISDKSITKLENYSWPGNIRELEHTLEKAIILCDGSVLQPSDFNLRTTDSKSEVSDSLSLEDMEKIFIEKALKRNKNNISAVAVEMGITRPTLYSKIKKYGLS
ncbi:MAG: sigma-54 dependent transcriptional regulator [Rikenellaceae bacterium]|nr:sigma-54 dependent transcriptional regulator [Rikenellaceae bacterium]